MYAGGILCNTFELVWMPRLLTRKRKEGKEDDDREGSAAARVWLERQLQRQRERIRKRDLGGGCFNLTLDRCELHEYIIN